MEAIAHPAQRRAPDHLGARLRDGGAEFAVWSRNGDRGFVCLFDAQSGRESARWRLGGRDSDVHHGFVPGAGPGTIYGLRFEGPDDPANGHCFDPAKLLADPWAARIDRPFVWSPELAAPRAAGIDTAPFMPRAIIEAPWTAAARDAPAGRPRLIYEIAARAYSMRDPHTPAHLRGTLAALAAPRAIERLVRLGVSHVELMPVAAFMSERHLALAGLENAWGYNSAVFMAPDPRLAPGGMAELRAAAAALRGAGISTILDVVFNHTAEGAADGPTLSLRGLDNAAYYRRAEHDPGLLINDTGCGNTLASEREPAVRLITGALRLFAERGGVDGFRFDLAATLARGPGGFPQPHPLFAAIAADPLLSRCVMIAEPWDVGPGGYRLGAFPPDWLEWNDRSRDSLRKFWRGDAGAIGGFAAALAGSADIFAGTRASPSASVNFVAAHDGFTLRDLVSHERKHNLANGEENRDGANDNHSWNNGAEGDTAEADIGAARARDVRALLASLFLARGTPMLTAGDETGRTQGGNNNAYAQDNGTTWLDWPGAEPELEAFTAALAKLRRECAPLHADRFLTGLPADGADIPDVEWRTPDGAVPGTADWADNDVLCLALFVAADRVFIVCNRGREPARAVLPGPRAGFAWRLVLDSASGLTDAAGAETGREITASARGVCVWREFSGH